MAELNAAVVLAALDDILEPPLAHRGTHLSIMRHRVKKLRDHVAEYVEAPSAGPVGDEVDRLIFGRKFVDGRDPACVERWPDAVSLGYDPRCCRFPKSCSAGGFERVEEPPISSTEEAAHG